MLLPTILFPPLPSLLLFILNPPEAKFNENRAAFVKMVSVWRVSAKNGHLQTLGQETGSSELIENLFGVW